MPIFHLIIISVLLVFPKKQGEASLEGIWERKGDEWEGMQIKITRQEKAYKAVLLTLPPHARQWGFKTGDIKWRGFTKTAVNTFEGEDLYIEKTGRRRYYQSTKLVVVEKDILQTTLFRPNGEWIGQRQTWVKVSPHHL